MNNQDVFWWGEPLNQLKQAKNEKKLTRVWVSQLSKENDQEVAILNYNGLTGKCYASEFDKHEFSTIRGFVGHQVDVIVKAIDEDTRTFEASRTEADLIKAKITMKKLKEGERFKGTVSGMNPAKNTIFIDIGGIDGFCYLEDWDFVRYANIQDAVHIGQPVEVVVKSIIIPEEMESGSGTEQFVRLDRKELLADPWNDAEERYAKDNIAFGKVVNIDVSPDGRKNIFISLERGITILGRIPRRSNLPQPVIGQPVRGRIAWMDKERRRGFMIINSYPHGDINQNENLGAYIYN